MKFTVYALAMLLLPAGAALADDSQQSTPVMPDLKSLLAIADKDEDGIVTRAEFIEARASLFPGFDTDGSGDLSKEEFVKAMSGAIGSEFFARRAFGVADANDDDRVTIDEWNALPTRAFDRADKDGDGRLTPEEIEKI